MNNLQIDGKRIIMDVRERIAKGEHPRREILNTVKAAPVGSILEFHMPFRAEPLIANLQSLGLNVVVTELEPMHFRLMAVKLDDIQ